MSQPYYVTLTGARNNAGDFLIRQRGHALLREVRPDRGVRDLNGWEPLSDGDLALINGAAALLLLGGPALRRDMYPRVYPLVQELDRISVPIIPVGVGWHASPGTWEESRHYDFTPATRDLLLRCVRSGFPLGVRDYRSLNALAAAGIAGGVMTGCPALYLPERIGTPFTATIPEKVRRLVVSPGVTFLRSPSLARQLRELITGLRQAFPQASLTVAFHHALDAARLRQAYGKEDNATVREQGDLVRWLEAAGINYVDVSGTVDRLLEVYGAADFHVGYRVHAHICMSSMGKPSVLLTEDGRGRGLREVLGGLIFDSWRPATYTVRERLLKRLGRLRKDRYCGFSGIAEDVQAAYAYETAHGFPRLSQPRQRIDLHYPIMRDFLRRLP